MSEELVAELGVQIANQKLPAGKVFTIGDVCEKFGVSRAASYEAMRVLKDKGMLEPRRRVGLRVTRMDQWTALDPDIIHWRLAGAAREEETVALGELCSALAPLVAWSAASRASPAQQDMLLAYAERMREQLEEGRFAIYVDLEISFISLLFRSVGNRLYSGVADILGEAIRSSYSVNQSRLIRNRSVGEAYLDLATAVSEREPAQARQAMISILNIMGFEYYRDCLPPA